MKIRKKNILKAIRLVVRGFDISSMHYNERILLAKSIFTILTTFNIIGTVNLTGYFKVVSK